MTRLSFRQSVVVLAVSLTVSVPSLHAGEALLPSTGAVSLRAVTPEGDRFAQHWRWYWKMSLAPLVASEALDAASSYGMRELNPVLAGPDGRFGAKATAIKFGAIGGLMGAEYLVVRKYPRSAKVFTIVNWAAAGATASLAVHNYRLQGR